MLITKYTILSLALLSSLLAYTHYTFAQFYDMTIFLFTNKLSFVIMCNTALLSAIWFYKAIVTLFLGQLRDSEFTNVETRFFQHLFHAGIILFLSRMANSILSIYILMIDLLTLSLVAIAVKRVDYMRAENINSKLGYLRVAVFHVFLI